MSLPSRTCDVSNWMIYCFHFFCSLVEPPMRSLPISAEFVEPSDQEEVPSPPPPYSTLAVQSYSAGNDQGRFKNSYGLGSGNICIQSSIPEVSRQDNPELVLTEGIAKLILTSPLIINHVLTAVGRYYLLDRCFNNFTVAMMMKQIQLHSPLLSLL